MIPDKLDQIRKLATQARFQTASVLRDVPELCDQIEILTYERDKARDERDSSRVYRDAFRTQRDEARREYDNLQAAFRFAVSARDEACRQVETLRSARDQAQQQRDELAREVATLQPLADSWHRIGDLIDAWQNNADPIATLAAIAEQVEGRDGE